MNPLFGVIHLEVGLASSTVAGIPPILDLAKTFKINGGSECVLSHCARAYNLSVLDGILLVETPPTVDSGEARLQQQEDTYDVCWKPHHNPSSDTAPSNLTFCGADSLELESLFDVYSGEVGFQLIYAATTNFSKWGETDHQWSSGRHQSLNANMQHRIKQIGIEQVLRGIANTFTKAGIAASNTTVRGTAYASEVYVSVNWTWVALPGSLVTLGAVFHLLTILLTRRQGLMLWKSSLLAVLFYGLLTPPSGADVAEKYEVISDMEQSARAVRVRLRNVEQRGLVIDDT
jgi:hypothetical protein